MRSRQPTFIYLSPMDEPTPREERAIEVARRFNRLYRIRANDYRRMTPSRVWSHWDDRTDWGQYA